MLDALDVGRVNVACRALGITDRALERALEESREREIGDGVLGDHTHAQLRLGEMIARRAAVEALVDRAAAAVDARDESARELSTAAKLIASDTAVWAVDAASRLAASRSYTASDELARLRRDAPQTQIGEGANDALLFALAKAHILESGAMRRFVLVLLALLVVGGGATAYVLHRAEERREEAELEKCAVGFGGEKGKREGDEGEREREEAEREREEKEREGEKVRGRRRASALFAGPEPVEPCGGESPGGQPEPFGDLAKANSGIVAKSVAPGTAIKAGAYRAAVRQRAELPTVGEAGRPFGTPPLQSYRTDYDTTRGSTCGGPRGPVRPGHRHRAGRRRRPLRGHLQRRHLAVRGQRRHVVLDR